MYVREDAAKLLLSGLRPAEIAHSMQKDIVDVKRFLLTQVGEGALRLSDILFSIPENDRNKFENVAREHPGKDIWQLRRLRPRPFKAYSDEEGEFRIYQVCRDSERGDMYVFLADIEISLHKLIKQALVRKYGDGETGWWQQGIPLPIRKSCVSLREEDSMPSEDPFAYTTLMNLREILDKSWPCWLETLPESVHLDKRKFLANLARLNYLRNGVMHPVKKIPIGKEDFLFVKSFRELISTFQ